MKANVFPEPVFAAPRTSLPFRMWGIDLAWISVQVSKPSSFIAFYVYSDKFKSSNFIFEKYWSFLSVEIYSFNSVTLRNSYYIYYSPSVYSFSS